MFHDSHVVKNEVFLNPSISSLELSWVIFHLKPSLRNVAIVVLLNDPIFLFILLVEQVFISSLISSKQLFFVSGRSSPQVLRCLNKSTRIISFRCCFSNNSALTFLQGSKLNFGTSCHSFSVLLFRRSSFYPFVP